MKVEVIKGKEKIDITSFSGNLSLSTSLDALGASLSFDIARNYNDNNFKLSDEVEVGNIVRVIDEEDIFIGIIVDEDISRFKKSFKCLDFAFYLNSNKVIKQFNKASATSAIKDLLKEIGMSIGTVANMSTAITKIYKSKTVAEVIIDVLKQVELETGKKYRIEMNGKSLDIREYKDIEVVSLYNNLLGEFTYSKSITDMRNKVQVTSNNQESVNIEASVEDKDSINKYGMLQEIIEVEPSKDISNARNIAKNSLEELNKIFKKCSIKVLGTPKMRAGRLFRVVNKEYDLDGKYLIRSCSHNYSKGHYITTLELEV